MIQKKKNQKSEIKAKGNNFYQKYNIAMCDHNHKSLIRIQAI